MKKLIEALTIFAKYQDREYPTHCGHDALCVVGITRDEVSVEDQAKLTSLGFLWSDSDECWISFKYGSA
jgi:hypothetical protein